MDLGLGLDSDDIFDNCHGRTKELCKDPYSVRLCPELWFNTIDVSRLSNIDAQTTTKYRGDVAYREEQFESALLTFQRCRDLLPPNNVSMRRGVEEDVARSHLRLGQLDRALECAKNVVDLAQNMEQVTAVLHLLLDIYKAAGSTAEMLCTVKKLLLLHPNNSGFWTQLGDLHSSASSSDSAVQACDASCSSQTIHTRVNGVLGRVKHCCHIRENSQTTPDGELRSITVRRTVETCDKLITNESLAPNPPPEDSSISNATRTVCDCSQRGQIVSARDSDCLFDPLLHQFESMSCDGTSPRQVSGERDRLVICLTCFVAARLLLTSVHCRLNSFARAKNEQDQLKVESRLDSLLAQSDLEKQLLECSEFLSVALNVAEPDESIASTNRICDMTPHEVLCEDERSTTAFDRKWFSWMKNDVSSQDQFEH